MDGSTVAALILFGPGAGALPAVAALWHRSQKQAAAERAVFAELTARTPPVPPTPGIPAPAATPQPTTPPAAVTPAAGPGLAPVIDLAAHRRAA